LPVYEHELDNIIGVLHLKQVVQLQRSGDIEADALRSILRPAYFVPAATPFARTAPAFQSDRERLGLVVDEYGELKGLTTIEDIIERSSASSRRRRRTAPRRTVAPPMAASSSRAGAVADAQPQARTKFPIDGPKTLNGLIVDHLGEIPAAGTHVQVSGQTIEILQTQDRGVKVVRLLAPVGRMPSAPLQSQSGQASSTG
jgi:Mg2+/Co2+ transporter CorB